MELRQYLRDFIRGMGSIFDLSGSYYGDYYDRLRRVNPIYARTDLTSEQKVTLVLRSDWIAVGKDLEASIQKFERENLS